MEVVKQIICLGCLPYFNYNNVNDKGRAIRWMGARLKIILQRLHPLSIVSFLPSVLARLPRPCVQSAFILAAHAISSLYRRAGPCWTKDLITYRIRDSPFPLNILSTNFASRLERREFKTDFYHFYIEFTRFFMYTFLYLSALSTIIIRFLTAQQLENP